MTDHDSPLPDRAPHDSSPEAPSDDQHQIAAAEQSWPTAEEQSQHQAGEQSWPSAAEASVDPTPVAEQSWPTADEAPVEAPVGALPEAADATPVADAAAIENSDADGTLPADDSPATGPLHTLPGGPDWHSRPSGALRATPVEAWSQAGTPGYHDPSVDAQTWFASRPATGQVPSGPAAASRPSGPAPRAGYPTFTGAYQQPGVTGATPQAPAPGWHHTRTDLPPLGAAAAPAAVATEKPKRKKTTLIAATTVALALAAGFGGGLLGAHVGNSADVSAASDSSLTQQSAAAPVSAVATSGATIESVAAKVLPSVVSILATSDSSGGEGSGIILTKDGLILTNGHVIEGATDLTVRFNDGTTAKATVVGADTTDDLAVIKAEGVSNLTPATLGTSANLVVGQQVVAVGSPLGLSATVTSGIVSALNRPVRTASSEDQQQQQQPQDPFGGQGNGNGDEQQGQSTTAASGTVLNAIQTDAAINPGNSGGPLVDMNGSVIGINSAIASLSDSSSSSQSGSIGVGFSIPIDQAHRIAQEIINTGKAQHAVLGASVRDNATSATQMPTGALVASVTADGGAAKAGLKEGDVITKVGDLPVDSADALIAAIRSQTPGGTVKITYVRGSDTASADVTLGATSS